LATAATFARPRSTACARPRRHSRDEMVDVVQPDKAYHDEVDSDDVI
jgi:hypothetical protein